MSDVHFWISGLLASALALGTGRSATGDVLDAVDPFWGSGGTTCPPSEGMARGWNWEKAQTGNTHPGATRPFGWVSVCAYSGAYSSGYGRFGGSSCGRAPEISNRQWAWGFTHFHGSGTGDTGRFYNYFRFEPSTPGVSTKCRSRLDDEVAEPGYYAAKLTDYRTAFELTAAPYAACHRYRFDGSRGKLVVDLNQAGIDPSVRGMSSKYRERAWKCEVKETAPGRWEGHVVTGLDFHFALRLKAKVLESSCIDGVLTFITAGPTAESVIGFSLKDTAEAAARADAALAKGFDAVRGEAAAAWREKFGRLRVDFADEKLTQRFYSALYHSMVKPGECGEGYYGFSTMWDMSRTQLPLVYSFFPDTARGIAVCMMDVTARLGHFPNFYNMCGNHGSRDSQATALAAFSLCDAFFRGAVPKSEWPRMRETFRRELAAADIRGQSPTHVLDLAGAHRAAAFVAEACGDAAAAAEFMKGSDGWRTAYDPETGYLTTKGNAFYYEGNERTYSFRPHVGMAERIALAGGRERFLAMLDDFFSVGREPKGWTPKNDRQRRPGHFEGLNNESDIDAPLAYVWVGRPDRLVEVVQEARKRFVDGEGGCPGNNDSGGTSAWYVWSGLGLFPVSGTSYMVLSAPYVDSAEVAFAGRTLRIEVERESVRSDYPVGYSFAGRDFTEPWIRVDELAKGGALKVRLGDRPTPPTPVPDWL